MSVSAVRRRSSLRQRPRGDGQNHLARRLALHRRHGSRERRGLHFAGRAKWVIKPAGYQVFPGDVESALCALDAKVASCGVVGAPHQVRTEAIVAFVERRPDVELTAAELKQHARSMASFMRPLHFVVMEPGQMPLNRAAKIDYVRLHQLAIEEWSASAHSASGPVEGPRRCRAVFMP